MMQSVFQRHELKYLLSPAQKEAVLAAMHPYMRLDCYGRTTIRNIYFDTDDYRLIRRSLERPVYKEKLRLRSYHAARADEAVFVELKKKYFDVVYKRRISLAQDIALRCLREGSPLPLESQIAREIDSFRAFYATLAPHVFLSYEREALYNDGEPGFRVTFDENLLYRRQELSLSSAPGGTSLLPAGVTLMEIKTAGAMPLWMARCLTQERIFKTTFSKYGAAYRDMLAHEREAHYA